jgi:hypothetical protein
LTDQNGTKEVNLEQRNNKLMQTEKDITSKMEDLKEEMNDLSTKLKRIDYDYIQTEMQIREHRTMQQKLEKECKDNLDNTEKLEKEIKTMVSKMNQIEMDFKVRSDHIGQDRLVGESLFGNRLPSYFAQNSNFNGASVHSNKIKKEAPSTQPRNAEVKKTGFLCSLFGFDSEKSAPKK